MAWKYRSEDRTVGVVVDPCFQGDLIGLAKARPLWVVDSDENRFGIDSTLLVGADAGLFEVSRFPAANPEDRVCNLLRVLEALDEEYGLYRGFFAYGLDDGEEIRRLLDTVGFRIEDAGSNVFFALMIPTVRGALIGRDYSKSS